MKVMLFPALNAFCNFIGSANIPAGGTKTWRKLPDVFFPSLVPRPSRAPTRKEGLATIQHLARPYDMAVRNVGWPITVQHSSIIRFLAVITRSGRCLVPTLNAYLPKSSINAAIGEAVP